MYKEVKEVSLHFDVQREKQFKVIEIRISGANVVRCVYDESDNIIFNEILVNITYINRLALVIFTFVAILTFVLVIAYTELVVKEYWGKKNEQL